MSDENLMARITALWEQVNGPAGELTLTACPVSGNNRVFIVRNGPSKVIAKWFFRGPAGTRDRMESEWRMLRYAEATGIGDAPRPIARDTEGSITLQEFIEGKKPTVGIIGAEEVRAAALFFQKLNRPRSREFAATLPDAAEACFSMRTHFEVMDKRLNNLRLDPKNEIDLRAIKLIERMRDFWSELREDLSKCLIELDCDPDESLSQRQRCVSPADFGFHNTLIESAGALRFFDFEYAGWDDPAKMLCDFFLTPAIPVSRKYWAEFVSVALADWEDAELVEARAKLMMPMFGLKWCCIMLNPFVPTLASPGRFANPGIDQEERKARRLERTLGAFECLPAMRNFR